MLPLVEWVVLGSLLFWMIPILFVLLFIVLVEEGEWKGPLFIGILLIVFLVLCSNFVPWVIANGWKTNFVIIGGYLIGGMVWGPIRWILYGRERVAEFKQATRSWLSNKGYTETSIVPDELKDEWREHFKGEWEWSYQYRPSKHGESGNANRKIRIIPPARQKKETITTWMGFWPVSMTGQFVEIIVKKLWKAIFEWMESLFDWISKMISPQLEDEE